MGVVTGLSLVVRSTLFNLAFYLWAAVMNIAFLPTLAGPRAAVVRGQAWWAAGNVKLLAWLAGIGLEVRGREHMPKGAAIVASKHQSVFETFVYHMLLDDPAIVLKKELLAIPLYGWYTRKTDMVPVDRTGGAAALREMLRAAQAAADRGRPILIFPEGTRAAPGARPPYQPGVAALYGRLGLPAVPVALNSGHFWPRRRFLRHPGTIVVEFLEPIPPGLDRRRFMALLRERIDEATARLEAEAEGGRTGPAPLVENNPSDAGDIGDKSPESLN